MSILAQPPSPFLTCAVLLAVSLVGGWLCGVFRLRAVAGPSRLASQDQAVGLMIAFGAAVVVWLGTQFAYVVWLQAHSANSSAVPSTANWTPWNWGFLACVPSSAALVTLVIIDATMGGSALLRRLGLGPGRVPAGVARGLLGCVVILPVVLAAAQFLEWLYTLLRYAHPEEHELLKAMGDSHAWPPRLLLITGAVVVAPLFEELLFRGHLQTLIRQALLKIFPPRRWLADAPGGEEAEVLDYASTPTGEPLPGSGAWQTWAAILITSGCFAVIHPLWSAPIIFLLAVGLGYVYERTGLLWAPVFIHFAFNALETTAFLLRPNG